MSTADPRFTLYLDEMAHHLSTHIDHEKNEEMHMLQQSISREQREVLP